MVEKDLFLMQILVEYDLKIVAVEKIGTVWKVTTDRGIKCLRSFLGDEVKLNIIFQGLEHIARQGFRHAIRFIRTKHGQPYIKHTGSQFYYLCDWFDGINCDYTNLDDISLAAEFLARFHCAAEGFKPDLDPNRNLLPWVDWGSRIESRINDLSQYKDLASKKVHKSRFDRNFLKYVDYYIHQGVQALKLLKLSKYQERKSEGIQTGLICHGDYRENNLIINESKKLFIIDFDNCRRDIKLYDLTRFLEIVLVKNRWNWETGRNLFFQYDQYFNLNKDDLLIVLALLCFPRRFWAIAKRNYRDSQNWDKKELLGFLKIIIREEKVRGNFLTKFNHYYRRFKE